MLSVSQTAIAEDIYYLNQSQSGFNLPGVTLPQGQDEVRAADGTTCRSAVSGTGAYLDVGAIRSNKGSDLATYGRVVVPLGTSGDRLDCSQLYQLEVERLRMELAIMKMGLAGGSQAGVGAMGNEPVSDGGSPSEEWANTGWSGRP
ncbi:hypothetical protein FP2506_00940 [Fulvimarina pelagi HTCC2506]|uniref:Uncharacterized protein n=1 Tax=Fulvimarina pelagi HTCC2506 TaxID=314231 RepID=Q0G2A9_9HYPH|nr:hypothetical protein [Fulvimarina pelagi]EAU41289.1 hypothetical protein FP2506_00940 [Fulvimarina pelagi HTCC2506]